ncbi:ABC transporter substrate-binding protein [Cohnella zeiphila]|uniref:Extracellular solute-binding protein n=1 Tax=Cohnella zeiphila TaxID=2761120 RepID=A0A7X0SI83_9BACL|nr:extracellular solute-binding protein [Cohnella zeiphila]MBB6730442.1 extracellular solute-binding protein [Cohnella zeiphila]
MRKTQVLLAGSLLTISLAACSGGGDGGQTPASSAPATKGSAPSPSSSSAVTEPAIASPASDGESKTIVFQTYQYNEEFAAAIKNYEALHPNITIKLNSLAKGEEDLNGLGLEKFRQTTSTQLLAGQGPDLIDVDWLPTDRYAGKNILTDLGAAMASDPSFHKEDYFDNIIEPVGSEGEITSIPMSFFMQTLVGDQEAIEKSGVSFDDKSWNWDEFAEAGRQLVAKGGHEDAYVFKSPINLLYQMVQANLPALVDAERKEAHFDSDLFIGMLNGIRKMEEDKVVTFDISKLRDGDVFFQDLTIDSPEGYLTRMRDIQYPKKKLYYAPKADGQDPGGYFTTYDKLAINAHSKVQAEAWDFLKYLMSDPALTPVFGLPINRTVYEKQVDQLLEAGQYTVEEDGSGRGGTFPVTKADLQPLDDMLSGAAHPLDSLPGTIEQALFEETPAFFSGQKTAETVAKLIQNKATTYLNE